MKTLEIANITKTVKGNMLLDDVSFSVEEGEVVALIGPNGAGKSTIMKIASNLVFPSMGKVVICGNHLAENTVAALSCVSAMIEAPPLYPQLTGKQHLEMIATLRNKTRADINRYICFSNLGDKINQRTAKYSIGMKQRLYLTMTFLAESKVLILDEPTNGLDFSGVSEFREQIKKLSQSGVSVLLSSHTLSDLSKISDKFVFIYKGKILSVLANNVDVDIEHLYEKTFANI